MSFVKPSLKKFLDTLTPDVLTAATFIDWRKITEFTQTYRRELALLGALAKESPLQDLADLLVKYPSTLDVMRILIGHGGGSLEFSDASPVDFKTGPTRLRSGDKRYANELAQAFNAMGLIDQLRQMRSVLDYSKGTLVGLEPNKRKNRRGEVFQTVLIPGVLDQAIKEVNETTRHKIAYKRAADNNITIELGEDTQHPDFAIFAHGSEAPAIALEVNFYASWGSKPSETLTRAYPDLQRGLRERGIGLIVITDGMGWRKMRQDLGTALSRLDYLLNYQLARGGGLADAIVDHLGRP